MGTSGKIFYLSGIVLGILGALLGIITESYLSSLAMSFFALGLFLHYKFFLNRSKKTLLYAGIFFQVLWLILMLIRFYTGR